MEKIDERICGGHCPHPSCLGDDKDDCLHYEKITKLLKEAREEGYNEGFKHGITGQAMRDAVVKGECFVKLPIKKNMVRTIGDFDAHGMSLEKESNQ